MSRPEEHRQQFPYLDNQAQQAVLLVRGHRTVVRKAHDVYISWVSDMASIDLSDFRPCHPASWECVAIHFSPLHP